MPVGGTALGSPARPEEQTPQAGTLSAFNLSQAFAACSGTLGGDAVAESG